MTLTRDQILSAVVKTNRLPSVPDLVLRLEEELRRAEPRVVELGKIIEQDPALSLRILSLANSAFYHRGKQTTSVRQALLRLGFVETRRMAVAATLVDNYRTVSGRDPHLFWGHCLAVAFATRGIVEFCTKPPEEAVIESAFTCGLLHDLGILAIGQLFSEEYEALEKKMGVEGGEAYEVERNEWGIDHGEIGGVLARRWELPESICEVIEHHHEPWLCSDMHKLLAQLVHLANFICDNQGFARRAGRLPECFDESAWEALGLSLADVPRIIERVASEGERSLVFMGAFR